MRADLFELKSLYFNSAYLGPTPKVAQELIAASVKRTLDPAFLAYDEWFKLPDQNRARLAALLNVPDDSIALSTSVSELVSHVANGIELHAQDEVLLLKGDYPAMVLPWLLMAELKGLRVHFLELEDFLVPSRFKSKLSDRTRVAACSHVMFNTGIRLPIAELGRYAQEAEVLFLSDVSQSFGGMRLSQDILKHVDIFVGVMYKWMLGPYGSAFGRFSERALNEVRRTHASWSVSPNSGRSENLLNYTTETLPGARRFDRGQAASFLNNAALEGALETLADVGLDKIEAHNAGLVSHFVSHLPKIFQVAAPTELRSNIVCIKPPEGNALEFKARLAEHDIDVSVREGNLRLSFHLFNTRHEVEKLLKVLQTD
ncbi:MAG: aminotransferase class V-fold PLP-dependent enzyme [Bdellovibrionales bacterium]|nr:aminotransferase class V-fold PLP-dependent enzyme [Bdellovibrionales bacterium]